MNKSIYVISYTTLLQRGFACVSSYIRMQTDARAEARFEDKYGGFRIVKLSKKK